MMYDITLEHKDFVLILSLLKKAQEEGIITWDAAGFICEHTKVKA